MATIKNLAKGFSKLLYSRLTNKRFPLNVFFVVTNKCNLRCDYCYGEYYNRRNMPEFTTDEIIKILNSLQKMGTVFLQVQGGEPLMRNDIGIILDEAKKRRFSLDMITNGILIKQKIEDIKKVDSICVSLDGCKNINDINRGANTFEKIIEGIKLCRKEKITTRINSIITNKTTLEDIKFLLEFSKENRCLTNFCPSFEFKPLTTGKEYKYFLYQKENYNSILNLIIDYKKKKYPIQFTGLSYRLSRDWPLPFSKRMAQNLELPKTYKLPKCLHGDYVCFIDGDGRLYPCCNFWNNYDNINVRDDGFENAWDKLTRKNCAGCYIYSYIDRNLLLNFNFTALKNYFNNAMYDLK